LALPAWLAVIVQVPAATPVTSPDAASTVHAPGVLLANTMATPEAPPVALTLPDIPVFTTGAMPNTIVWLARPMLNVNVACAAALKLALPA
jgi:hypothetical protein